MSTPTIDYDALAKQHGGIPTIDYDALAAQHGGTVQASPAPESGGVLSTMRDLGEGAAKGLTNTFTAVPALIGNAINEELGYQKPQRVIDQEKYLQPTDAAQKVGKYGEQAAEALVPLTPAIAGAWSKIPTTAKAGKLFDEVMSAAKDVPVNLTRTQPALERVAQLTDAGAPVQTAPNKLLLRSQTINPLSYQDARDFYSNISQLSAQDKLAMNGPMKRAVNSLRVALKDDIGDTASSVGKGPQYYKAMSQYKNALRLQNAGKTVAKGAATAAGAGAVYSAFDALRDLMR